MSAAVKLFVLNPDGTLTDPLSGKVFGINEEKVFNTIDNTDNIEDKIVKGKHINGFVSYASLRFNFLFLDERMIDKIVISCFVVIEDFKTNGDFYISKKLRIIGVINEY